MEELGWSGQKIICRLVSSLSRTTHFVHPLVYRLHTVKPRTVAAERRKKPQNKIKEKVGEVQSKIAEKPTFLSHNLVL